MATVTEKRVVGVPTPRVEGEQKVTGRAVYAGDVVLPGMLWVKFLRSSAPHARIKKIDIDRARQVPGVQAVMSGKDVSGAKIGKKIVDMPILAETVVRFVGEKVAAVAAESEEIAAQALDLIEVEYDDLPPVFDPLQSMLATAPILHPEAGRYAGLVHPFERPSNVMVHMSWKKGDVTQGFKQSDLIVENIFSTARVHQA